MVGHHAFERPLGSTSALLAHLFQSVQLLQYGRLPWCADCMKDYGAMQNLLQCQVSQSFLTALAKAYELLC